MSVPRLSGRGGHRINYRHIIDWLVRKPGAFRNYRYREDLSRWNTVLDFCPQGAVAVPEVTVPPVDLRQYDLLLAGGEA